MSKASPSNSSTRAPSFQLQRQLGFRWLEFIPELEEAYRQSAQAVANHQIKVALYGGLLIWLAFIGMDVAWLHKRAHELLSSSNILTLVQVRFTVLITIFGGMAALREKPPRFHHSWVVAGMLYLITLGSSLASATHIKLGTPHDNSLLILLAVAIFLPLGLRLRQSIAVAMMCLLSVLLVGLLTYPETHRQQVSLRAFSMLIAAALGGLGAYLREYAQREQFLLREELAWLARRDALTGLLNRRAFNEHLDLALSVARREQRRVALLMVDVDHFKLFNDAYGHATGDHALQQVAEVLRGLCRRPLDDAARTGGEEMTLVLYGVDAHQAQALCEQLIAQMHVLGLAHATSPTADHITLSVGCALSAPHETAQALYKRADTLLYQAKRLGRNRAVVEPN